MFTGIVETVGSLVSMERRGGDVRMRVAAGGLNLTAVQLGDSIATNGVCLTVIALQGDGFIADVSLETLSRTTLGGLAPGSRLNLESALTLSKPLGGHLVSGHVDGVGEVTELQPDGRSVRLQVRAPQDLARYIAVKGSICLDGVSLTVNQVRGSRFHVNLVPHTLQQTIVEEYRPGTRINIEVDMLARYLERLVLGDRAALSTSTGEGITLDKLALHGFLANSAPRGD